ncbi:hypothetical protein ACFFMP_17870 [Pseudoroseomonas cervicalis]|uniref:hypothetical protein n=1 Tax=Teichococcus cervicalis TaxID=204525 RepID=UPI0035EB4AC8
MIPALVAGSAVAGGLSMLFACTLRAPHGGIFVVGIPGAVGNPLLYRWRSSPARWSRPSRSRR